MTRSASSPNDITTRFAPLTEADIKAHTDSGSYERGRSYFRNGRIRDTALRNDVIQALCQGSEAMPYRVEARLALRDAPGGNPRWASCTCPRGGFCKHIVALLLTWIDAPERFHERQSIAQMLEGRTREELVALIDRMIERYPDLESLAELTAETAGGSSPGAANVATLDEGTLRRQMDVALKDVDVWEWDAERYVATAWQPFVDLGKDHATAGNWANAVRIFTVILDETFAIMESVQIESGDIAVLIVDSDDWLAAALDAQADLPEEQRLAADERLHLIRTLYNTWRKDIFEYGGLDLSQLGPESIARNVTPDERETVMGWLLEEDLPENEWMRDWRLEARNHLIYTLYEHAGLDDGQLLGVYTTHEMWDDAAWLLLGQGNANAAIEMARQHVRSPRSLVPFVNELVRVDDSSIDRAISLVDDLLWETEGKYPGNDALLRTWLAETYAIHGRPREALDMTKRQFLGRPTLETFRDVQAAAIAPGLPDDTWEKLRPELEAHLLEKGLASRLIDVYLDEGDVGAALELFRQQPSRVRQAGGRPFIWGGSSQSVELAKAAEAKYPDDAVKIYRDLAAGKIANRERSSYHVAAEHLARVKAVLDRHDRGEEWRELVATLREEHKTLRALQDELNKAGL